jgi:hypothetical protein
MESLPPVNSTFKQNYNLIELHVGFAAPFVNGNQLTHQNGETEIFENFHLTLNGFSWVETIDYRYLYDLNTNIIPFGDDEALLQSFPNLSPDEFITMHKMLTDRDFDEANVKLLQSHTKNMETWMYTVICNLHKIDEESRQMCKQLFFRSEEKLVKYEHLVKLLKNKQLLEDRESGSSMENSGLNKVFRAMTSLFSLGSQRNPSMLSERNLERHTRIEESRAVRAILSENANNNGGENKSVSGKSGQQITPSGVGSKKRTSFFARSMGTRSAMDKKEIAGGVGGSGSVLPTGAVTGPQTALDVAKNTALLKIEVTRGNEAQAGVVMYDITLRMAGKKGMKSPTGGSNIYKVSQRFSAFKKLWMSLIDINNESLKPTTNSVGSGPPASAYQDFIQMIKPPFPALPMKCYLGFSLNESELSQR